ncbi:hypothetical protein GCM10023191_067050 [Actinoallomurus oryzae]|uniref:Uncharacterized protein n=1 Tax=Actinoallomurus oryzae TaxID=502180 RepID=A0ABP8QRN9_9ACTN
MVGEVIEGEPNDPGDGLGVEEHETGCDPDGQVQVLVGASPPEELEASSLRHRLIRVKSSAPIGAV